MRSRCVLFLALAFAAVAIVPARIHPLHAQAAEPVTLTGVVSSADEGHMEGVLVSAKKTTAGATVTVTVVTDKDGRYRFPASRLERSYFRRWLYQNGRDVSRLERGYVTSVPFMLGVPRYLWRTLAADALSTIAALIRGDAARRFASALRLLWFAGYVRESWFGETVPALAFTPVEGR